MNVDENFRIEFQRRRCIASINSQRLKISNNTRTGTLGMKIDFL